MRSHAVVDSPVGPLTLVEHDGGVAAVWMTDQNQHGALSGGRDDAVLPALREQLAAYWQRQLTVFDVRLAAQGTSFQQRVWTALRLIPYGATWSYQQLAAELGQPGASRAVGLANSRNPIGIVVPCHRVVGASGHLTGYAGGLERKRFLLDLESGGSLF